MLKQLTTPDPRFVVDSLPNISHVLQLRRALRKQLLSQGFLEKRLIGATLFTFVKTCEDCLGLTGCKAVCNQVLDSVTELAGQIPTLPQLEAVCWRLAGNVSKLAVGPIPIWQCQRDIEWVPLQIISASLQQGGKKHTEMGYRLEFRVLAGTPAGMLISQWWSRKKCFFMGRYHDDDKNGFCFSRQSRNEFEPVAGSVFVNPQQLVTLRFAGRIEPSLCRNGPNFLAIRFTTALSEWNREQQRHRARKTPKYRCPKGYGAEVRCCSCPVGSDTCRAATHPTTYVLRMCSGCRSRQYHDPSLTNGRCVRCVAQAVLTG